MVSPTALTQLTTIALLALSGAAARTVNGYKIEDNYALVHSGTCKQAGRSVVLDGTCGTTCNEGVCHTQGMALGWDIGSVVFRPRPARLSASDGSEHRKRARKRQSSHRDKSMCSYAA